MRILSNSRYSDTTIIAIERAAHDIERLQSQIGNAMPSDKDSRAFSDLNVILKNDRFEPVTKIYEELNGMI